MIGARNLLFRHRRSRMARGHLLPRRRAAAPAFARKRAIYSRALVPVPGRTRANGVTRAVHGC